MYGVLPLPPAHQPKTLPLVFEVTETTLKASKLGTAPPVATIHHRNNKK
jgi:hypothetical protein